jgi:hypothetical protein
MSSLMFCIKNSCTFYINSETYPSTPLPLILPWSFRNKGNLLLNGKLVCLLWSHLLRCYESSLHSATGSQSSSLNLSLGPLPPVHKEVVVPNYPTSYHSVHFRAKSLKWLTHTPPILKTLTHHAYWYLLLRSRDLHITKSTHINGVE